MEVATNPDGGIMVGLFLQLLIFGVVALALFSIIFWVWALVDCASNEASQGNDKIVWILVILFLQILGAFLYVVVRRPARIREQRAMQQNLNSIPPPPIDT